MTRILVIESEGRARQALRNILEDAGYEVELAEDGTLAASLHSDRPADLVIADVDDVAPAVQAFANTRMLTMPTAVGCPEKLRAVAAQNILPKPFRRDDLLAAVRVTLDMAVPPSSRPM